MYSELSKCFCQNVPLNNCVAWLYIEYVKNIYIYIYGHIYTYIYIYIYIWAYIYTNTQEVAKYKCKCILLRPPLLGKEGRGY